jgi:hypothetical protein
MTTTGNPERFLRPILDYGILIPGDRDGRTKGDAIQIGADYSPGKCDVRNPSSPRKWDKRSGWGLTGATVVYIGDDLSEFSVDFYLWTQPQQSDWDGFYSKWLNKPYRTPALGAPLSATQAKANDVAQQQIINQTQKGLAEPGLSSADAQTFKDQQQAALTALKTSQQQSFLFPPQPKALGISHPALAKARITAVVVLDVIGPDTDDVGGVLYTVKFMQWQPATPMWGRPDAAIPGAKVPVPTASDSIEQQIADQMKANQAKLDNLARGQ